MTVAAKRALQVTIVEKLHAPLKSTAKYIKLVDRMFCLAHPLGLLRFSNEDTLTFAWLDCIGKGNAPTDAMREAFIAQGFPQLATLCHDELQKQISGDNILGDDPHFRISVEGIRDFSHRIINDKFNAMKRSGMYVFYLAAVLVWNVARGPWESCAFMRELMAHASRLTLRLVPDSPEVLFFWKHIVRMRGHCGETDPALVGQAARSNLIAGLKDKPALLISATKISTKNWFSLNQAMNESAHTVYENAIIMTSLAIDKGWVPLIKHNNCMFTVCLPVLVKSNWWGYREPCT